MSFFKWYRLIFDEIDLSRSEALDMMRHDGSWEQKQEETTNKMRSNSREMGSLPKPFRMSQQKHGELTKIVNSWLRGQWCWWRWRDWKRNGHRPLPILLLVEKQYLGIRPNCILQNQDIRKQRPTFLSVHPLNRMYQQKQAFGYGLWDEQPHPAASHGIFWETIW